MTSSPPSSRLAAAVSSECPALPDGNRGKGLRSLWHLSRHLTARADDNHAAPSQQPRREGTSLLHAAAIQARVRFLAYHRIKPHVPPLVRAPVNSFEFHHRLPCGLPGYLILFDTRTFEPQRQLRSGQLPSQSEFFVISKHFTATPQIPPSSRALKKTSINCTTTVERLLFTTDLISRLRSL